MPTTQLTQTVADPPTVYNQTGSPSLKVAHELCSNLHGQSCSFIRFPQCLSLTKLSGNFSRLVAFAKILSFPITIYHISTNVLTIFCLLYSKVVIIVLFHDHVFDESRLDMRKGII